MTPQRARSTPTISPASLPTDDVSGDATAIFLQSSEARHDRGTRSAIRRVSLVVSPRYARHLLPRRTRLGHNPHNRASSRGSVQSGFNEVARKHHTLDRVARPHRSLQIPFEVRM